LLLEDFKNIKTSTSIYKNIILLFLNYELLNTSYLFIKNTRINHISHKKLEPLYNSQKKIIKHLNILLDDRDIILLPILKIYDYIILNKINKYPLFLISVVEDIIYAHGVNMYPLSFFFHDIQHAFEIFKKNKKIYKNPVVLQKSIEVYDYILNKINDYRDKKIKKIFNFILFLYTHELVYSFTSINDFCQNILKPFYFNFYDTRLDFVEYTFERTIEKNFSFGHNNLAIINKLYPSYSNSLFNFNNKNSNIKYKKTLTVLIKLLCYTLSDENTDISNVIKEVDKNYNNIIHIKDCDQYIELLFNMKLKMYYSLKISIGYKSDVSVMYFLSKIIILYNPSLINDIIDKIKTYITKTQETIILDSLTEININYQECVQKMCENVYISIPIIIILLIEMTYKNIEIDIFIERLMNNPLLNKKSIIKIAEILNNQ
jgi:hypothetical protein